MADLETKNNRLITLIVTVYNKAEYLEKCLDSVISQDYKNLEILLLDDGSTDGSGGICDEYAAKDNRIRVFHNKNLGAAFERQFGIEHAQGDYIVFVDGDDFVDKDYVSFLYEAELTSGAELVINLFEKQEKKIKEKVYDNSEALDVLANSYSTCLIVPMGKLYDKNLFGREGCGYVIGKINEDESIIHHLMGEANKVYITSKENYHTVLTLNSVTRTALSLKNLAALDAIIDRIRYIEKNYKSVDTFLLKYGYLLRYMEYIGEFNERNIKIPLSLRLKYEREFRKYLLKNKREILKRGLFSKRDLIKMFFFFRPSKYTEP